MSVLRLKEYIEKMHSDHHRNVCSYRRFLFSLMAASVICSVLILSVSFLLVLDNGNLRYYLTTFGGKVAQIYPLHK